MNSHLTLSKNDWPEVLVVFVVSLAMILELPSLPAVVGFVLYGGLAYAFCFRWKPEERSAPCVRFVHYLRVAGVFAVLLIGWVALATTIRYLITN